MSLGSNHTGESTMNNRIVFRALIVAAGFGLLFGGFGAVRTAQHTAAANVEFIPLIVLAPDDNQTPSAPVAACVDPDGHPRSTVFHCYTPTDIYAAYGVDALHAEGTTGKGQTIVIVDSYGSPTVQADLDRFSDTFGLPRTTIQIIHPHETPTFNNSVHGSPAGGAFETSLDGQWPHAIAPDAHIVLGAA